MLTIPTIPGQDTIGIYGGGFNSPSAGSAIGAYYLLVNPENTLYLASPDIRVYPTYPSNVSPIAISPALWLNDTGSDPSVWTDISGNGRHATSANPPAIVTNALNGRQVRRFDGINDTLSLAADLALGAAHTIFVVAKNTNTITETSPPQLILNGGIYTHPSTNTSEFLLGSGSVTGTLANERLYSIVVAHGDSAASVWGYAKTNSNVTGPFIIVNSFNSASDVFYGKLNDTVDFGTVTSSGGYSAFNTRYPTIIRHIGSRFGTQSFWNGDIAEILVYPTALSAEDREKVERYLGAKYNILVGFDPDAADYFTRIAAAGSSITNSNKLAINAFITGCKADGIWPSIKASCLLAGPDSLAGALVPLVGTAPTNINFVSGDYNRTTGLIGNGVTKYLNSNRNNNADPQNNQHMSVRVTEANTFGGNTSFIGNGLSDTGCSHIINASGAFNIRTRCQSTSIVDELNTGSAITGTVGMSRSSSSTYNVIQQAGVVTTVTTTSETPFSQNTVVFGRNLGASSNARLSFYSIGESLDLALLDARLTAYMASLT